MKKILVLLASVISLSASAKIFRLEVPEVLDKAEEVSNLVHVIQDADEMDTVLLGITSEGGSVIQGMRIIDAIKTTKAAVKCTVVGMAASMSALIATSCPSLRAAPGAIILFHHIYTVDPKTGKKKYSEDPTFKMLAKFTNGVMKNILSEEDFLRVLLKEDVVISSEQFSLDMCNKLKVCG